MPVVKMCDLHCVGFRYFAVVCVMSGVLLGVRFSWS